jgi:folate-binding protein YgfZ
MNLDQLLYADRSERGKLRFTGPQRAWFLHQILTQSLEDMAPGEARDAAMITVHGRMVGYLEIVATKEALLAHFEPEVATTLPDAIRRYVFATRVEIDEVTDDFGLVLVVGPSWRQAAEGVAPKAILHPTQSLGVPAGYLWIDAGDREDVLTALKGRGADPAAEEDLEAIRVERGMARWGRDMDNKTLPPEVGLDDVAVHYDKGCYVGQEAMAKIKFRGKVNRRLRRIHGDRPLRAGADAMLEGAKVGTVTSAAGIKGLALLRYTVEPGTRILVDDAPVEVVA